MNKTEQLARVEIVVGVLFRDRPETTIGQIIDCVNCLIDNSLDVSVTQDDRDNVCNGVWAHLTGIVNDG